MRFCLIFIFILRVGEGKDSPFSSLTEHFRSAFPPSAFARPQLGPFMNFSPGILTTPAFLPAQLFSLDAHCKDHEPAFGFEVNFPPSVWLAGLWNTFPGVQCGLGSFFSANSCKSWDVSSKMISCMRLFFILILSSNSPFFQQD